MKLVYVVTEDWFFYIHRLPTMRAALECGFDVTLVAHVGQHRAAIEGLGARVIDFPFDRKSKNPLSALIRIIRLAALYRRERPDIVHHIALQPILFGTLAAWLAGVPRVVNGFVGLGTLFYGDIVLARVLRPVVFPFLRAAARRDTVWTLFENGDDLKRMADGRMAAPGRSVVIPGSGVDPDRYRPAPLPPLQPFICMFAGRMIAMKGLQTIRDAFVILKDRAPHIHLWLCGMPDPGNPESWSAETLRDWERDNSQVTWKGHQPDMAALWPQVHLALQPTIGGEGLPVSLLEAAACARPMVATDVPGCREIAVDGETALLVPERDPTALAQAILDLAGDPERLARFGRNSRRRIEDRFAAARVVDAMQTVYRQLARP